MIQSKNIFLADDDVDDRFIFELALNEICEDCQLTMSTSGDELLGVLQQAMNQMPDIIFLDINMPRKSGIETLEEIRLNPRFNELPVIMYSTSSNPVYIELTRLAGALSYFIKPSDFTTLKKQLTKILTINWQEHFTLKAHSGFVINPA